MTTQVDRLRLLYTDILGVERGKYLYGEMAEEGRAGFCVGVYPLTTDREILEIPRLQFDVGLHDVEAVIDRDTLRPGWEPETMVAIADIRLLGKPVEIDPREVLRQAVRPWQEMGLEPQVSLEGEFFLLEPHDDTGWRSVDLPSHRVYGTGAAVDPTGTVDDIVRAAVACGFPVEAWCSEFDSATYEINLRYRDALPAADDAFLFRLLAREIAARHQKVATFIGRPFNDRGGSGTHINLSFRRDDGSNALHDTSTEDGLSDLARKCIGGLLAHHQGLAAICAPHVNAYKRLKPDMLNGYWANWGHDDRTVCVRVPGARGAGTRLEHRMADGAANPYLTTAVILHAARFGVEHDIDPPPPQPVGEPPDTDVHVPDTLADALKAFESDHELGDALGPWLVTTFSMLKQAEWERYVAAVDDPSTTEVTDWELDYYIPFY